MESGNGLNQVSNFIINEYGLQRSAGLEKTITPETRLEADLALTGDEAWDFMQRFFGQFGISGDEFEFHKYFHPEGLFVPVLTPLLYRILNGEAMPPPPSHDLTVEDLTRAVQAGRWVDPI